MKEKKTKVWLRGIASLVLLFCFCLLGNGKADISAEGIEPSPAKLAVANKTYNVYQMLDGYYYELTYPKKFNKMRLSCTSSNKKVAQVLWDKNENYAFHVQTRRPGKTTLTFKAYKKKGKKWKIYKTYKIKLKVNKYEQPIKAMTVGDNPVNIRKSISYNVTDSLTAASQYRFAVECNKNWKLISVIKDDYENETKTNIIKSVQTTGYIPNPAECYLYLIFQNTKTKGQQIVWFE